MHFKNKLIRLVFFLFLFPACIIAQNEDEDVTYQAWLDYNVKYYFANKLNIYADLGARTVSPYTWARFYFRPAISFTQSPFTDPKRKFTITYHLGVGVFYTNNVDIPDHTELRPFQGCNIQWPNFKRLRISHYFRLEERFGFYNNENDFGLRARYMIAGIFRWNWEGKKILNSFYFPFHTEFFWNLATTSQFNDLVRITPGLGYHINADWRIEFDLSYHRNRDEAKESFETNDIVFRLRVFQDIL